MPTLLVIPGSILLLGIALLIVGLRGKRRGDHLHCRSCAFDLTGLRDATITCPECGSSITSARDRVRGVRVKSRGLIIAGIVVFLIGSVLGAQRMTAFNYYRYAPNLLLVQLLYADAARTETAARITDGKLTGLPATQAVNRALAVQGNRKIPWHDTWGAIIEEAGAAGLLTSKQTLLFCEQAITLKLGIRPKIQTGRRPSCYVQTEDSVRVGPNANVTVAVRGIRFSINGQEVALPNAPQNHLSQLSRSNNGGSSIKHSLPVPKADEQVGHYSLKLVAEPTYTVTSGVWTSPKVKGAQCILTAATRVFDRPTGDYIELDAAELKDHAANAKIWIMWPLRTGQRSLVFSAQQPRQMQEPVVWIGVDGDWVDATPWIHVSGTSNRSNPPRYLHYRLIALDKIRKRFPKATHVDMAARPNAQFAESGVSSPHAPPLWLGELYFRNIPLDAPESQHDPSASIDVPSLVPAVARPLTLEEAEKSPQ